MPNHYLVLVSKFGCGDLFLDEPFKCFSDGLYEGHAMVFFVFNLWYTYFILVKVKIPILGLENVVSVMDFIGDAEAHIFKFWDDEGVRNPFLVDSTLKGTKISLLVGGIGTCIAIPKNPSVNFYNVCEKLLIVHLIVSGAVVQVDPVGVHFSLYFAFWFTIIYIPFSESLLSLTTSITCVYTRLPFYLVMFSSDLSFLYSCVHS